jgi:hypothetical protein
MFGAALSCFLLELRENRDYGIPNRNFSSNEWMTEFLFCGAFKTPCKQASMQTSNPSLCLYLNDLWSECFCIVSASVFSIVKVRSLFCVMMMEHECSWNLVSNSIRLIKKPFWNAWLKMTGKGLEWVKTFFCFFWSLLRENRDYGIDFIQAKTNSVFQTAIFQAMNGWPNCDAFKTTFKQASMQTCNQAFWFVVRVFCLVMAVRVRMLSFGKGAGRIFSIVKARRSLFCVMMMDGNGFLFFLFLYCKCWANLPKSQYESSPAAAWEGRATGPTMKADPTFLWMIKTAALEKKTLTHSPAAAAPF